MDDILDGLIGDPGTLGADAFAGAAASSFSDLANGGLGDIASDAANLVPDYSSASALLSPGVIQPVAPAIMDEAQTAFDTSILGLPAGTLDSSQTSPSLTDFFNSPIATDLGNIGTGIANAFLINPQNAQTQAQTATTNAELQSFLTGNIFSYLLIGLVIFLVFGFLEKEA